MSESFVPEIRYENTAIHKVFRYFHNFFQTEIFYSYRRKVVFRGCLMQENFCKASVLQKFFLFGLPYYEKIRYNTKKPYKGCLP